jgi:hypothetical protein
LCRERALLRSCRGIGRLRRLQEWNERQFCSAMLALACRSAMRFDLFGRESRYGSYVVDSG